MDRIYLLKRTVQQPNGEKLLLHFQVTAANPTEALFKGKMRFPNLPVKLSEFTEES